MVKQGAGPSRSSDIAVHSSPTIYSVRSFFHQPRANERTMSDTEYAIESADAGASDTIPMEAGAIKKGG